MFKRKFIANTFYLLTMFAFVHIIFAGADRLVGNELPFDETDPYNSQKEQNSTNGKPKMQNIEVTVRVILGSLDEIDGQIVIPKKFSFQHYKNGLTYTKIVDSNDLKSIKIIAYSISSKSKAKEGTFYEFVSLIYLNLQDSVKSE